MICKWFSDTIEKYIWRSPLIMNAYLVFFYNLHPIRAVHARYQVRSLPAHELNGKAL